MKKLVELEGIKIAGKKIFVEVDDDFASGHIAKIIASVLETALGLLAPVPPKSKYFPSHFSREVDSKKDLPDENR